MQKMHGEGSAMSRKMMLHHYAMLGLNLFLSLIIMYFAMFAMIFSFGEFTQNINFVYMALVMWAPMAAVMLLTMKFMYSNAPLNLLLYGAFAIAFVLSLAGIRAQGLVGDAQFVRSMIPHHSGAVLMCSRAPIQDAEIRDLCFGPN
jgi:FtsH-binding integral membrane protein